MKILKFLLVVLAAYVIGNGVVKLLRGSQVEPSPHELVSRSVRDINSKAPVMVDSEARLDSASASDGGLGLVYHYTLINYRSHDLTSVQLDDIRQGIISDTCQHRDSFNIPVEFRYKGSDGIEVQSVRIDPKKCIFDPFANRYGLAP